jgi:thymidylate synthase ThyX
MEEAIDRVEHMIGLGLHKQIANRMLEPWAHINVVVTSSQWANFFNLRCHPAAQPEIKVLAEAMHQAMTHSGPLLVTQGQWHLPYVHMQTDWEEAVKYLNKDRITRDRPPVTETWAVLHKVSTARCARVSYLTHDGRQTTVQEDIDLYHRLVVAEPLHASPAEHQATPDRWLEGEKHGYWEYEDLHGNLVGWIQHRKTLPGEFLPG